MFDPIHLTLLIPLAMGFVIYFKYPKHYTTTEAGYIDSDILLENLESYTNLNGMTGYIARPITTNYTSTTLTSTRKVVSKRKQYIPRYIRKW